MGNSHWESLLAKWEVLNDRQKAFALEKAMSLAEKMGKGEWFERLMENVMGTDRKEKPARPSGKPAARQVEV